MGRAAPLPLPRIARRGAGRYSPALVKHPLLRLVPLFRQSRGLLALGVGGLLVGAALGLAGPWIVARAIDEDLPDADHAGLAGKALLFLCMLAAGAVVSWAARMGLEVAAQRAMVLLKERLFDHLLSHDLAFHDRQESGRLLTRVQGDTESLRVLFTDVILSMPADLGLFAGMFAIMAVSAPEVAPLVFAVIPPYVLLFLVFRKVAPPTFMAVRKVKATLTGFLAEHLRAMPVLQLAGRERWAVGRAEEINSELFRKDAVSNLIPVGYFNAVMLVRSMGMVLLLWVGAGQVARGAITVGALVMGLGYLRQMFGPLFRLSFQLTTIERARAAAIRIAEILDTERTIRDPESPTQWPGLSSSVRLSGVGFHYEPGTPVLRGLEMTVPAGSHVGIVGATGSGKTTVANLLLRFRDPVAGSVTVDGVDLRDLRIDDLRSRVGLVLQDVQLFAGTVLDNLGGDAGAAAQALATLQVDIPLDREVIDGGANLSRGERQLLTFARALVREPELLVLDEATSSVDPATEARVQEALARLQAGRTTVTVAHRLSTVRACDLIYVLHHGCVRESGTHEELLARGGLYAALHALQAGEEAA